MFNIFKKKINTNESEIFKLRNDLVQAIDENIRIAEEDIENIKSLLLQNQDYKTDFLSSLYNSSIYISIFDMDVSILTEKYILSNENMKKNFFQEFWH